jgi:hypothetical protein
MSSALNPAIRRRLHAIGLVNERDRLILFLRAIVNRAIRCYENEFLEDGYALVQRCAEIFVGDTADLGAFSWFGIRDGGDLIAVPWLIAPGPDRGLIVPDVGELARLILSGGTRREWLRPRDLEFTGDAR